MLAGYWVRELLTETEIDKIYLSWVLVPDKNVFQFNVIVDEA